uniref:Uncharacterized protein n=1 Tax=Panagrolaimus superbus TaxID=310955 RepID=A0A914YF60_9BILA
MLEDKTYRGLNLNIDKFQSKIHVVCNLVTYSPKKQTFITSLIPKLNNDVVDLQIVLFDNKTEVPCEIILANFPKIKWYRYFCPQFVSGFSKTVKELLKIPHFSNLEIFEVLGLSESFDIEMYFSYLKNNKKTTSVVTYNGELSEEYKNKLQAITDEILDAELPKKHYLSPLINFNGQFRQTELTELCNKNFLQMTYSWC